jgi:UDP-hydrolysing UDP-N-acetyl-D-glucosamine 2-epimerase
MKISNMSQPLSVCVVLVDRANYGRLKPVMTAFQAHPDIRLQVIAAGTMVLERFGLAAQVVRGDGFPIDAEIHMELEGSTPATMAKSLGIGIVEFAGSFQRLRPDVVVVIGDRYEALGAALAAAYMNICLVHIQGGEVSGSIDESARHAISKLAHFHVPSTKLAAEYLIRMGERPDTILTIGCPSSDLASKLDMTLAPEVMNGTGAGAFIDAEEPFLLVVFHPTTTEYGDERHQMDEVLSALQELAMPTLLLWPNIDAGADHISKSIRVFRVERQPTWLRTITNLSPDDYLRVLGRAACAIGNSSSFVRDAGYFGTPVVLVGARQEGREISRNTLPVEASAQAIEDAGRRQLKHGRYAPSSLYGDGHVADRVAMEVARLVPYYQKRLHYIHDKVMATAHAV